MRKRHRRHLFNSRKQSWPGLISFSLGVISTVSMILVIYGCYERGGRALVQHGAVAVLCLFFALAGLIIGILARREPERIYLFAWLGILLNSLVVAGCFVIMYLGLM